VDADAHQHGGLLIVRHGPSGDAETAVLYAPADHYQTEQGMDE